MGWNKMWISFREFSEQSAFFCVHFIYYLIHYVPLINFHCQISVIFHESTYHVKKVSYNVCGRELFSSFLRFQSCLTRTSILGHEIVLSIHCLNVADRWNSIHLQKFFRISAGVINFEIIFSFENLIYELSLRTAEIIFLLLFMLCSYSYTKIEENIFFIIWDILYL